MPSKNTPKIQYTHPMGPDGLIRCKHGEQVDSAVSKTDKNPGRVFYVCSRPESEKCGFWYWADDPIFKNLPPQTPASPTVAHAHAPMSSQSARSTGLRTPQATPIQSASTSTTLQSTPTKRKFTEGTSGGRPSQTPTSSADTPSKRARIAAIEAGLRARLEDESVSQSQPPQPTGAEQPDALPFTNGIQLNQPTSAPSPSDTDTDVGEGERPHGRYSFLGLFPSQESEAGAVPSTPKKRPSSITDGSFGEASSSALLTPPQSIKQRANRTEAFAPNVNGNASARPEPVTPTRSKGKERANPQWDQLVQGEENPFVDTTASSFKSRLEVEAARASPESQGPSCVPTTGECITAHLRKLIDATETFRAVTEHLNQLDALHYIERLERQKSAFAVANEAKKKRIAELEAQMRQYEGQIRQKDEMIAALSEKL